MEAYLDDAAARDVDVGMEAPTSAGVEPELGRRVGEGRTAEIFELDSNRVVKLYRDGWPRSVADAERVATAHVARLGGPSPMAHGVVAVGDRIGLVLDRVSGTSMLDALTTRPWRLVGLARELASLHVSILALDGNGLTDQRVVMTERIRRARGVSAAIRDRALARLESLPQADRVCHGDLHPDNVVLGRVGRATVIDWTAATRGHPAADVAQTLLLLRLAALPPAIPRLQRALIARARDVFARTYARQIGQLDRNLGRRDVARWRLPIAVARLGDGVPGETHSLVAAIERLART